MSDERVILTPEQVKEWRVDAERRQHLSLPGHPPMCRMVAPSQMLDLCHTITTLRERLTCGACDDFTAPDGQRQYGCDHHGKTPNTPSCAHWRKEGKGKNE